MDFDLLREWNQVISWQRLREDLHLRLCRRTVLIWSLGDVKLESRKVLQLALDIEGRFLLAVWTRLRVLLGTVRSDSTGAHAGRLADWNVAAFVDLSLLNFRNFRVVFNRFLGLLVLGLRRVLRLAVLRQAVARVNSLLSFSFLLDLPPLLVALHVQV